MNIIEILDYQPAYQPHFKALNTAWIEKHFVLEEIDKQVLDQPQESIYKNGGIIIMATYAGTIAGTVALKREDDTTFEMTKMAVDERFQGYKIGYELAMAILEKAKLMGAEKVILYSQTSLAPAIQLYQKIGFKEVELEQGKYKRCNIKMEIVFKAQHYLQRMSAALKQIIDETLLYFNTIQDDAWKAKPELNRWSKKEILGHLIDSAANNHQRFVRGQYNQPLEFPTYDQNQWVSLQNYHHMPASELTKMWSAYNHLLVNVIRNMRYDTLEATCTIGNNPPVTLSFLVEDYIQHLKHHLAQICTKTAHGNSIKI